MILDGSSLALIALMGAIAGAMNAAVGAGTFLTYPTLVAMGLPPVMANGTNTAALSFGAFSSAWSYRRELRDRIAQLRPALISAFVGALVGSLLVIALDPAIFEAVVPWLILLGTAAVAVQPLIRNIRKREGRRLWPWTGLISIYGGYFGAGQGVMLMAALLWVYDTDVQRSNAAKNLVGAIANATAALVFIAYAEINWWAFAVMAPAAIAGGYFGGAWARRLPGVWLRGMVVAVGLAVGLVMLLW